MPKAVITIPGVRYSTTFTQAGTVEAVLTSGTRVHLKAVNEAGQCTYTAISGRVEVSDNAAVTVPETNRVVPAETGVGADEVEQMILDKLVTPEAIVVETEEGNDNSTCNFVELPPSYSFEGKLSALSFRTASSSASGMTTAPMWCAVWEAEAEGSSVYVFAGLSSNTVTQAVNSTLTWEFDDLTLHGRALRLIPTTDPAQTDSATAQWRVRVKASTDGAKIYLNNSAHNYCPRMTLTGVRHIPRYAEAGDIEGLTDGQKAVLAAFEWDSVRGISFIHTTDGAVDNRLRVMLSATGTNLVTSGTLTMQAAQVAVSTRTCCSTWTDSTTGTSYNYGGHTMSETEMAPYGIDEPCVWCGEPTLPLRLRGSELRWNDTTIDMAKLAQLLAKSDELLALVQEAATTELRETEDAANGEVIDETVIEPPVEDVSVPAPEPLETAP